MNQGIRWESDFGLAKSMAKVQEKLVMINFFNPGCGACKQMDADTYPNSQAVSVVHDHLIAMRINVSTDGELIGQFRIQYTPTIVLVDGTCKEHYRSVGFLPPEEFIPSMLYGVGKFHFQIGQFEKSDAVLDKLLTQYPSSGVAVEARKLRGTA
jgi:thioredoxin-related protein